MPAGLRPLCATSQERGEQVRRPIERVQGRSGAVSDGARDNVFGARGPLRRDGLMRFAHRSGAHPLAPSTR